MASNQAQIEADAALARRLQEEEFSHASLPHLPIPSQITRPQPPSHPSHPSRPSRPSHPSPHPPSRHQHQQRAAQPHYPQPNQPQRQQQHQQARFPFARGSPDYDTTDMLDEMFNRVAQTPQNTRAFDSLLEFGTFPGRGHVLGGAGTENRRARPDELLSQLFGEEFAEGQRYVMMPPMRAYGREGPGGRGDGGAMEMMNMLFSGAFQPFAQGMGIGTMGGAGIHSLGDMLRAVMQGGEGGETYEDWLSMIERMGGNVNRGATDEEVGQLATHRFERTRTGQHDAGPSRMGSNMAGPSSMTQTRTGSERKEEEEEDKCAVCLGEYEEGEEVKALPCAHMFHAECVDRWLKLNRICPVCKRSIRERDRAAE